MANTVRKQRRQRIIERLEHLRDGNPTLAHSCNSRISAIKMFNIRSSKVEQAMTEIEEWYEGIAQAIAKRNSIQK